MSLKSADVDMRPLIEQSDFPVNLAEQPSGWQEKEAEMQAAPGTRLIRKAKAPN
jgi:hypothetical protein